MEAQLAVIHHRHMNRLMSRRRRRTMMLIRALICRCTTHKSALFIHNILLFLFLFFVRSYCIRMFYATPSKLVFTVVNNE
jgi:hypothetical protein